ncbi:carboxypeptidase-like regulatory domain-containing protein, partial [Phocaeicola sp. RTP21198st1_B8_RTP21198_201120]|uniref:carboxypeptidase-like regulatory domain-containing protein n=1 Tax=Phocaeicola sp. RTP21198st1_B8_RTP21198_201120 TaxID=3143217 RepID=UPI00397DB4EE
FMLLQSTNVTLNLTNVSLETLFKTLERKSNYVFFFKENVLQENEKVTVKAQNESVVSILNRILPPRQLTYTVKGRQVIIVRLPRKEERKSETPVEFKEYTVKGTVIDATGQPLPGVNITVQGTTQGATTDLSGSFTLQIKDSKRVLLVASYIGFSTKKVWVSGETHSLKIMLEESSASLNEVVVVGYGTQKKAHLTGAIATVPMDDIQDLASGNLASTLSGMVNGLSVSGGDARPGENARINIRQNDVLSDIGGTASEPLYVIDGYIYPVEVKIGDVTENLGATAFNNLDPSVIESISVLKDAAAAVYGARAANGVILVTTKRGKQGAPKISYSGTFGVVDEVSRAKMLNAYQYGQLWNAVR